MSKTLRVLKISNVFQGVKHFLRKQQRSMCDSDNEIASVVTNGEANFEICSIVCYFALFGNNIL